MDVQHRFTFSRRALTVSALAGLAAGVVPSAPAHAGGWTRAAQAAQEPVAMNGHLVREVRINFVREHPQHPSAEQILATTIELVETPDGLSPPTGNTKGRLFKLSELGAWPNPKFSDQGLAAIAPAVFRQLGLVGVYVVPDPGEFGVVDGKVVDKRPSGADYLTLQITTGVAAEVRSVANGDRLDPEKDTLVNHPIHAWIRTHSPVQPEQEGQERRDLLQKGAIEDYAFRLSRRQGRRVDTALSASGTGPGAATLDYMVTENKPWTIFAQLSNTGTRSTSRLREHFGFFHNDLTNHDDLLTVGYQTANFSDAHTLYASYEIPVDSDRRVKLRGYGQWYTYQASQFGFLANEFEGDGWNLGGEVIWNFYQDRDLFLDAVAGATYKNVNADNNIALISGSDNFFVPHARVRLERHRDTGNLDAELGIEFNLGDLAGTDENLDALGRTSADSDWVVLKGSVMRSAYLEPLFQGRKPEPGSLAHEIAVGLSGQYAFGNRLIPNETQVAGGLYTVRGYPESVVSGDTAIIATAEYRYHVNRGLSPTANPGEFLGQPFRYQPQYKYGPTDWELVLKGFVDVGRVINSDKLSFEKDQTLVGAGIGAEAQILRNFTIRADWGFALRDLTDSSGAEIENSGHNELSFVLTVLY